MSDEFYTGLRDGEVGPILREYGMALTLRRVVPGVYDPITGLVGADTVTEYSCYGVIEEYKQYALANRMAKVGDRKVLISASELSVVPVAPQIGDQIVFPGNDVWYIPPVEDGWNNKPVVPLMPAGIPILYTVQVRQ